MFNLKQNARIWNVSRIVFPKQETEIVNASAQSDRRPDVDSFQRSFVLVHMRSVTA